MFNFFSRIKALLMRSSYVSEGTLRETLEELIEDTPSSETSIESDEREILGNVLDLRDLKASDVMMPRADIVAAPFTILGADLLSLFVKHRVTYIPIYKGNLDHVIGMVHIKDILDWSLTQTVFRMQKYLHEILFISPSMRTLDLLLSMRETGTKLAIVVDEYGGVDGLVTFGTLIEEVIGDIRNAQENPIQNRSDGALIADGRTRVDDLERILKIPLAMKDFEEEIDTLGGLVIHLVGHVPARGTSIAHPSGLVFEVLDSDPRRIRLVAVKLKGKGL